MKPSPAWGLAVALLLACVAIMVSTLSGVSALVIALGAGFVLANTGHADGRLRDGLSVATGTALRCGIVLLGLRLSLDALADIGVPGLVAVAATVVLAISVTYGLARWAGASPPFAGLVAAGFGICGQSAIAALVPTSSATEEEIGYAVGIVAVLGTIAVLLLPTLNSAILGMDAQAFGTWVGVSVHDTSQVVAAASIAGPVALASATVVKLSRVLLLGPVMVGAMLLERRRGDTGGTRSIWTVARASVPWFVVGFVLAVAVRTSGLLPDAALEVGKQVETLLLATAMVGLGASIRLRRLLALGGRPLIAGCVAWAAIAAWGYVAASVTTT